MLPIGRAEGYAGDFTETFGRLFMALQREANGQQVSLHPTTAIYYPLQPKR